MAKLLETLRRQVTWRNSFLSALRANPRRRILLAAGAVMLGLLLAAAVLWPKSATCEGCQCSYCDYRMNGTCYINGNPVAKPIGCVGSCTSDNVCEQVAGGGGCGADVVGCRDSDCKTNPGGKPTSTATVTGGTVVPLTPLPPTATPRPDPPIPSGCGDLKPGQVREWTNLIPPKIGNPEIKPDHPVVIGQDPDKVGFRIHLTFTGGRYKHETQRLEKWCGPDTAGESEGRYGVDCTGDVEWHYECPVRCTECYDDPLAGGQIHMRLADSTKAWIEGELADRYPGTKPKEGLPRTWQIQGLSGKMHYDAWWLYKPGYPDILSNGPLDPGVHGGRIVIVTKGTPKSAPQTVQAPYEAKVFLLDTTIGQ